MRRLVPPDAAGEVLCDPPFAAWGELARANAATLAAHSFAVAGVPAAELRRAARRALGATDAPFVIETGHQPDLWHCGIWIKPFLVDRLAAGLDAAAVSLVVDSDEATAVVLRAPAAGDPATTIEQLLAAPAAGAVWSSAPSPSPAAIDAACAEIVARLHGLPSAAPARCFDAWADGLRRAHAQATDLGDLLTRARRAHEAGVATRCRDLSLVAISRAEPFCVFAADVALNAERFVAAYNGALAQYRTRAGLRNAAQPLPDLARRDGAIELPFWWIRDGRREPIWARAATDAVVLVAGDQPVVALPVEPRRAVAALVDAAPSLAPRALTLTLFHRLFCSDLFVHGVGGGRYDQVTDDSALAYYGARPPSFAVATMTMHVDAGIATATAAALTAAEQLVDRFRRRPDRVASERGVALSPPAQALAAESERLRAALASSKKPDPAHRAALARATDLLRAELAALEQTLASELATTRARAASGRALLDRTYPICLFDPAAVRARAWAA